MPLQEECEKQDKVIRSKFDINFQSADDDIVLPAEKRLEILDYIDEE